MDGSVRFKIAEDSFLTTGSTGEGPKWSWTFEVEGFNRARTGLSPGKSSLDEFFSGKNKLQPGS
jgi:hypothetical protein